jgi:glycosyltransferase involved in cell wall biosynthesis
VPIIALGKTAVPETIGNEQLVYNEVDYPFFACALNLLIKDIEARNYLIDQGIKNFKRFSFEKLKGGLIESIEQHV